MSGLFSIVGVPLGWIMYGINQLTHNYGITLIIFAILVKILLIPLGIRQQKGIITNIRMQSKMKALQQMYGKNRQKYNEELQKLYNKEGFSPLSSCLPLLIQFPILFGMLNVIYYPITHLLRLPAETIDKAVSIAETVLGSTGMNTYSKEISVLDAVNRNLQPFIEGLGSQAAHQIADFDFTLFGLFLGAQPSWKPLEGQSMGLYLALLMIPILSGVTALIMSLTSMKATKASSDASTAGMNTSMMLMMPIMSVWISFKVPAGVGLYWLLSNILASIQTVILNRVMNPAEAIRRAKEEEEAQKERERTERIEAKKQAREAREAKEAQPDQEGAAGSEDPKALSQKEVNRRKLAEARRRDAERYGDVYVEVTDDDVR